MRNTNFYEMMKVDGYYEANWMNEEHPCEIDRVGTVSTLADRIRHLFHF